MTDLEWLARRVHKWSTDDPDHNLRLHKAEALNAEGWTFAHCYSCGYSFDQWQAERARLQNKPKWEDAPYWAEWLAQDGNGRWTWFEYDPNHDDDEWIEQTHHNAKIMWASDGYVLGDWRDTLERRPAAVIDHAAVETCVKEFSRMLREAHASQIKQRCSGADTSAHVNTSALDIQEGGAHYKSCKIQPVEYMHANGLGYCEGAVVKYVTRWKSKNGIEDLRKARHFIDLLIELEEREARQ